MSNKQIIGMPWYYIVLYVALGVFLLWVSDRFKIIKSKSLRYFIVIFVYSFIWWAIYDLFLEPK